MRYAFIPLFVANQNCLIYNQTCKEDVIFNNTCSGMKYVVLKRLCKWPQYI